MKNTFNLDEFYRELEESYLKGDKLTIERQKKATDVLTKTEKFYMKFVRFEPHLGSSLLQGFIFLPRKKNISYNRRKKVPYGILKCLKIFSDENRHGSELESNERTNTHEVHKMWVIKSHLSFIFSHKKLRL